MRAGKAADLAGLALVSDVEHPHLMGHALAVLDDLFLGDDQQPALGQRQDGMGVATLVVRPLQAADGPGPRPVGESRMAMPASRQPM